MFNVKPGQFYYHYKRRPEKGTFDHAYYVLGVGMNTEDRTDFHVIYKPLYFCDPRHEDEQGVSFHVRPYDMFIENVVVDRVVKPRFELITDPELIEQLKTSPLFGSEFIDE
jgi:hypothetical protein